MEVIIPHILRPFVNFAAYQVMIPVTSIISLRFLKENNILIGQDQAMKAPTSSSVSNATSSQPNQSSFVWLFDIRASHHVTSYRSTLHYVSKYGGPEEIILGDGTGLSISHIGHTSLSTSSRALFLSNILYVPHLHKNLISVSKLCKSNNVFENFFPKHIFFKDLRARALFMWGIMTMTSIMLP